MSSFAHYIFQMGFNMNNKLMTLTGLVYTLGMLSFPAMAQTPLAANNAGADANVSDTSGDDETPTHKTLSLLADRFNKLGLDALLTGMQNGGSRKMLAAFTADGALVYNAEIPVKDQFDKDGNLIELDRIPKSDRTQGMQIVPYTVSVLSNGRAFVSAGLMGFRNDDTRDPIVTGNHGRGMMNHIKRIPSLISTADVLVFEFDNHFSYNNMMTRKLKLGEATFAFPLHANNARTKVLALTAGGDVAFTQARVDLEDRGTIQIGSAKGNAGSGYAINPGAQLGLRYDQYSRRVGGDHLRVGVEARYDYLHGAFQDEKDPTFLAGLKKFDIDEAQFNSDMQAWYTAHGITCNGCSNNPCYSNFTGIAAPVKPTAPNVGINLESIIIHPSITVERDLTERSKSKFGEATPAKRRVVGATLDANLSVENILKGGTVNLPMMQHLNHVVGAEVFLKF